MRIIEIEAVPIEVPYFRPIPIALGVHNRASNIVVKLHTDSGVRGIGEISPLIPSYSGETQGTALSVLKECLGPIIIGEDPFNIEKLTESMDKAIVGHMCTKTGISIALYDVIGKSLNLPIYSLLGGLYREKIPVCFTVSWGEDLVEKALAYVEAGFNSIKVKIGRGMREDIDSLEKVREALGDNVPIIADANQAYSPATATKLVKEIEDYVEALEQPVLKWDIEGMAEVRKSSNIPIIADESASTAGDAFRVAKQGAADMFLLKVMRSGGFKQAKSIVAIGQAAGIPSFACSMTELGIGTAANIHFAASTAAFLENFGCSFDGPLQIFGGKSTVDLQEDIVIKTPVLVNGSFEVPAGPGLGVELDEVNIEKYRNGESVKVSKK
jgi:L-alanine-DL-glutamate epimerase-like enolase superfamily enzyme